MLATGIASEGFGSTGKCFPKINKCSVKRSRTICFLTVESSVFKEKGKRIVRILFPRLEGFITGYDRPYYGALSRGGMAPVLASEAFPSCHVEDHIDRSREPSPSTMDTVMATPKFKQKRTNRIIEPL
jgi:hypothetical protein